MTLLLALFGVGATAGNLLGGRLADRAMRRTLFGGLTSLVVVLALFPLLMTTAWARPLAVLLLGVAAFVTGSPLNLMVMEKASDGPSLASSANQAAFNMANAGGAWLGGLALTAGFGVTSPALAGAVLAALGLLVAGIAYAVDARRTAQPATRDRIVAARRPRPATAETATDASADSLGKSGRRGTCTARRPGNRATSHGGPARVHGPVRRSPGGCVRVWGQWAEPRPFRGGRAPVGARGTARPAARARSTGPWATACRLRATPTGPWATACRLRVMAHGNRLPGYRQRPSGAPATDRPAHRHYPAHGRQPLAGWGRRPTTATATRRHPLTRRSARGPAATPPPSRRTAPASRPAATASRPPTPSARWAAPSA